MGVPLPLEGDKKGTLTLDQGWITQVPKYRQEGLESAKMG